MAKVIFENAISLAARIMTRGTPNRIPFRLLTQYCRKHGLDDYEVKELIEDRIGRRLVCECELVCVLA
jgi:hypothetical protein